MGILEIVLSIASRFRTESSGDVVGRFNERFMLTLGDCRSCLVCDDELNVLPLSSHARDIKPLPPVDGEEDCGLIRKPLSNCLVCASSGARLFAARCHVHAHGPQDRE